MSKQLLKFSQPACTPCTILSNYLNDKGTKYKEIDLFEDLATASKYGIMGGLPVLILVDGEEIIAQSSGFNPANTTEVDNLISKL